MYMRLDMPYIDRQSERGRVFKWHVAPGGSIAAGETVCDVVVESIKVLEIPRNAKLLTKLAKTKLKTTVRHAPLSIGWRVTAREPGVLSKVLISEGEDAAVGDPLAVMLVGEVTDEVDMSALGSLSEFRVSTDLVPEIGDEEDI